LAARFVFLDSEHREERGGSRGDEAEASTVSDTIFPENFYPRLPAAKYNYTLALWQEGK
jgi:hypothetical protein